MSLPPLDFGLGLRARHPAQLKTFALEAQAAGFNHIWLYDSPRFAECYVAMTYCALTAPAMVVGTTVTNTETRDPTVTANGFATLSLLTGGRVRLGLGLGDSAVKFIGRQPAKIDVFREKVTLIRALLAGETVHYNDRTLRLPVAPEQPVPLLVAAEGPRTFELAGTLCDGAIISPGSSPLFLRWASEQIRAAAARAGRDPEQLALHAQAHCVVAENAEEALTEILRPLNRSLFRYAMRVPHEALGLARPLVPEHVRKLAADLTTRQELELEAVDELRAAMGDDVLHEFVIAGTAEHCRRRVAELTAVPGVRQVIVNFHAEDRRLSLATFRDDIIPAYRASQSGGGG